MQRAVRQYLAAIGSRGGRRSRRVLSAEQARSMVQRRESRKRAAAFERLAATALGDLPGIEIVRPGVQDLANSTITADALLVSMAAPRLQLLGIPVPTPHEHPESRLYDLLVAESGDGAHARYNALVRRMVSFGRAAAIALRHHA